MKDPRTFVDEFNTENNSPPSHVQIVVSENSAGDIYATHIRYPCSQYLFEDGSFDRICSSIRAHSKGSVVMTSDALALHHGIIDLSVNYCCHGYKPNLVTKAINYIVNVALPEAKKSAFRAS